MRRAPATALEPGARAVAIVPRECGVGSEGPGMGEIRAEAVRGVVSTVAAIDGGSGDRSRHAGIVDRVFGPERSAAAPSAARGDAREAARDGAREGRPDVARDGDPKPLEPLRLQPTAPPRATPSAASDATPAPASTGPDGAEPFIDPQFSVGRVVKPQRSWVGTATRFEGELVADEDVEIQGLVEGRVCARRSRVTVGREGFVKSKIEARAVRISGTVRGSVTAEDWVEIKPGAFVRGDVRAPRVILHDGAIVTGRLDMAAGRERCRSPRFDPLVVPPRPGMRKVRGGRAARGEGSG